MSRSIELARRAELHEADDRTMFGFWVYLMTDCVLFACLFAVYSVLHSNTFGGPSGKELFSLPLVLAETLILLTSSFTCGLAVLAARGKKRGPVISYLALTGILGLLFVCLEYSEFSKLVMEGNGWDASGFLSSFFTLVGTHGLHISIGLIWMTIMVIKLAAGGLNRNSLRQLTMLSLFWHFLDLIWIFIFTIVYLFGVSSV